MSQQHPYQASISANEPIQQSLFPSWHDRRHSHTTDAILDEGERKSGSFDKLQDIVNEKQKQEEEDKVDREAPNITITKNDSNKIKSIIKDTTSFPPAIVINDSEVSKNDDKETSLEDTASIPSIVNKEPGTTVRRNRSVRFNDDKEEQFIKTSK